MPFWVVCISALNASAVAEVEKRRSLAIRLLDGLGLNSSVAAFAWAGAMPEDAGLGTDDLRGLIRSTIEELAARGSAVFVDRAAEKAAARSDTNRADCLKRFHRISHESPADDDLVLNAERLGTDGTVDLVMRAAAN